MNAAMLVYPGAEELDVFGPYEVLRAGGIPIELVAEGAPGVVTLAHGSVVHVARGLEQDYQLILVPGGGWASQAPFGARREAENPVALAWLRDVHAAGAIVAGVCTGAMILARAGLLTGRPATTHHSAWADLAAAGARVAEGRVVDDGDVVTCGGVTAGIDLGLALLERFCGTEAAVSTAAYLEYERRR